MAVLHAPRNTPTPPWKRWLRLVVLETLLPAWLIVTFIVTPATVRGESMDPTLQSGDVIVVWKLEHWLHRLGVLPGGIERGAVIVAQPDSPFTLEPVPFVGERFGWQHQPLLVKRVLGIAGDTLTLRDGLVERNGSPVAEPYIGPTPAVETGSYVVPANAVFVLGDNRHKGMSVDSREFGPIPTGNIAGRAVFRLWPIWTMGPIR